MFLITPIMLLPDPFPILVILLFLFENVEHKNKLQSESVMTKSIVCIRLYIEAIICIVCSEMNLDRNFWDIVLRTFRQHSANEYV